MSNKLKGCFLHNSDDWRTPEAFYKQLNDEFHFDDDPCPIGGTDGLIRDWKKRVFVNPPYSNIKGFISKAMEEINMGHSDIIVFLVPSRTDTKWFHDYVLKYSNDIRFIRGRLKFGNAKSGAPFPSMIFVLSRKVIMGDYT